MVFEEGGEVDAGSVTGTSWAIGCEMWAEVLRWWVSVGRMERGYRTAKRTSVHLSARLDGL